MLHRDLLIFTCDAVKFATVVEEALGTPRAPVAGILDILAIEAPITLTCDAVELASVVEETLGAVARDTGAYPGYRSPEYWIY